MFEGLDISAVTDLTPIDMNWSYLQRLREIWPRKLVVKGIVTREDAELAVDHGVDGLIVSNHGGRAEDSGRASIDSLVEVVEGVRGRVPVLVDGGIRRGTDIFKALALGANAIAIGRPYIWGLASFGQEGVSESSTSCAASCCSPCGRRGREASPRSTARTSWINGASSLPTVAPQDPLVPHYVRSS